MRAAKTLGLALVALIAALAFVGVPGAMGEFSFVLCEQPELECENPWPNEIEAHLEAESTKTLTNLGTMECKRSLARANLLNNLAQLVTGHLLELTFEECKLGSTSCTLIVNGLGGFSVLKVGQLEASGRDIELEGKKTTITLKCGSFINCKMSSSVASEARGHSDAEGHFLLLVEKSPVTGSGFLCPKTVEADATYHAINLDEKLTLKTGLWIES